MVSICRVTIRPDFFKYAQNLGESQMHQGGKIQQVMNCPVFYNFLLQQNYWNNGNCGISHWHSQWKIVSRIHSNKSSGYIQVFRNIYSLAQCNGKAITCLLNQLDPTYPRTFMLQMSPSIQYLLENIFCWNLLYEKIWWPQNVRDIISIYTQKMDNSFSQLVVRRAILRCFVSFVKFLL